jgi:L-ascorbate metabolism protein UlaG (beta-lactamase superfamily)
VRRAAPAFFKELSKEYKRPTDPAPCRPRPDLWPDKGVHAAWLGHSTVLIKVEGFTILTDPVFSVRAGLNLGPFTLGIKRLVDVALQVDALPQIDLILLSHAHMDHFDLPSLRTLENPRTHVVTAYRTADLLRRKRYASVHELSWNQTVRIGRAEIKAFQVAHWGARMRSDVYRGYNGYVITIGARRILFAGDTAHTTTFRQLKSSQEIDLAIMPIGAYDPWIHVHCNPEQALSMANDAGTQYVVPVHHQTFQLSREPRLEPLERLLHAVGAETARVCVREVGGEFSLT